MREILFRGKTENGEWREGFPYRVEDAWYILHAIEEENEAVKENVPEIIPDTIGQYAGITDKDGKKIFEGDILECGKTGVVKFGEHEREVGFYVDFNDSNIRQDIEFWVHERDAKVIGNIHDNPELLEGGKG